MKENIAFLKIWFTALVLLLAGSINLKAQDSLPYLGQALPGTTPQRFAPSGMQSNGIWWWRTAPIFSPDGKEMIFAKYHNNLTTGNHKLYFTKDVNGIWTTPALPSFASDSDDYSPVYTNDGNTLFFSSTRDGNQKIYRVNRDGESWSEPELLNFPYSTLTGNFSWDISIANNGTMYYTVWDANQTDICKSVPENGQYLNYEKLPEEINSSFHDNSAFISPNEEYLIFASTRTGSNGFHDLYISFKKTDGAWTTAQNMGIPINAAHEDAAPVVSPDGKYLFFTSFRGNDYGYNSYWVDASVIEQFNPYNNVNNNSDPLPLFSVSPNLADNVITINYSESLPADLTIYNSSGESILKQFITNDSLEINIQSFQSGLYIIKISNDRHSAQQSFIKK